jgi:hypothetical protein
MEKLLYVVWRDPALEAAAFRDRLIGPVAERLLGYGAKKLSMNVSDEHSAYAEGIRITRMADPIAATISLWLDSVLDRAPHEEVIAETTARHAGYSVLESVPIVNTTQIVKPGQRTPGIQTIGFIEQKQGMDYEAWREQWQGHHTRVAIETQSTFQYIQNVVFRRLTETGPNWAAIVEEGFPAAAATDPMIFYDAGGSEERLEEHRRRMIESCTKFIDFDRLESHPFSEYVLVP